MPKLRRVLIVPDKFKGTLTAHAAAEAIARGWRSQCPRDILELLPMSDGGDGFGEVMSDLLGARKQVTRTINSAGEPIRCLWWWEPKTKTAIIESAKVNGLALLPRGKHHPFDLDTTGLGRVIHAALEQGAERCLIGIGGSATNDGGFGMAHALGWQFLDATGQPIQRWTELHRLVKIVPPRINARFRQTIVAVDVQNPLLGPQGCSRIYGPQKGLRPQDFRAADKALGGFAHVAQQHFRKDYAAIPGAGAAGGLGFALMAFLRAKPQPGIDIFARHAHLDRRIRAAHLVITAEGGIDHQTVMGKGVGEIAHRSRKLGRPCLGLAGIIKDPKGARSVFDQAAAMTPDLTDPESAMKHPAKWLEELARRTAAGWVC